MLLVVLTILITTVLFSKSVLPDQPPDFQWAQSAGGPSYDTGYGIARDMANNYIITGRFYESAVFGSTTLVRQRSAGTVPSPVLTVRGKRWRAALETRGSPPKGGASGRRNPPQRTLQQCLRKAYIRGEDVAMEL